MKEYLIAFFSGTASFFSPCVLPLIPGYLSLISGFSAKEILSEEKDKINNAYKNYRNPRNLDDTPDTIYTLSFGLYYCEKDVVKDAINREINGIELAIENLYKIMNAVK